MKESLITSHLLGGASGHNLVRVMSDREIEDKVSAAQRITREIKRQVPEDADRLMVAHLIGGTSGLDLSSQMTDQEIAVKVGVASRVLKELERQILSRK